MMTRSVEMTTENILENRINSQPSNRQAFNRQPLRSLMSFQQSKKMQYIIKHIQGCHSVRKSQEIRKSQEKMGGFEKKSGNLIK